MSSALITGNKAITGMPSLMQSSATNINLSRDKRLTPGMDETVSSRPLPFKQKNRVNKVIG